MKSVLISIQPKWCELIANGKKTLEVRKSTLKLETPFKCYIYATKSGRPLVWGSPCPSYVENNLVQTYGYSKEKADKIFGTWNGKVIGEFVCNQIDEIHDWQLKPYGKFRDYEQKELENFLKKSCLSYDEVLEYRKNLEYYQPLYGWHISNLTIYEEPKELSDFTNLQGKKITRAPQSWMYINDWKGEK